MAGILLNHVGKCYKNSREYVVKDLNLEIQDKEFLVLVGPSGCGKTTVLRMIAGLEEITEGEVFIGEQKVNTLEPKDRDIAMVFQNYALYPHLTVFGNIAYPLKQRKIKGVKYSKKEIKKTVEEISILLKVNHLLSRYPKELSGGERQRVALARAMVREPKAFLMDEPLSNLDAQLRSVTRSEILKLHRQVQTTFVYVTHDQTEALTMGNRIAVMNHGVVQQIDTPYEVFYHPANLFVAKFIGSPAMNFFDASVNKNEEKTSIVIEELGVCLEIDSKTPKEEKIIAGIRPENIIVTEAEKNGVKMQVDHSELMGTETILHLIRNDLELRCKVPTEDYRGEKEVNIQFDKEKIHFFSKITEQNLGLCCSGVRIGCLPGVLHS